MKLFSIAGLLGLALLLACQPVLAETGGPDGFGYRYVDSDEIGYGDFSWEDISDSGREIALTISELTTKISIGFNFSFYGNSYNTLYISNNGFLTFTDQFRHGCCKGEPIPTAGGRAENMIAAMWDYLNPGA